MKTPAMRWTVGLLAALALAIAAFVVWSSSSSSPSSSPESSPASDAAEPDPRPAAAGVEWLTGHLTNGLLDGACPANCGRNIDAALGLEAAGADPAVLEEMEEGFEPVVAGYISYSYPDEQGGVVTGDVGGAAAKSAVFAQLVEADADYGGVDLIARLAGHISGGSRLEGRLFDRTDGKVDHQYANTLGQAFAVRALHAAGHPKAEAATEWLAQQQCAEGFFREGFSPATAPDQSCDGDRSAVASVDTTAIALLMLQDQADDPEVKAALDAGAAWLTGAQHADGSWGTGPDSPGNANSTGMAGQALGELGHQAAAEKAALWVRGVQVDDSSSDAAALTSEVGAIGFDRDAYTAAQSQGITEKAMEQWQYATVQGLGALQFAPTTGTR